MCQGAIWGVSPGFNHHVTRLAPVPCLSRFRRFQGLKIIAFPAIGVIALRAMAIPQFLHRKGQVAMPALYPTLRAGEQYEILVKAF